MTICSGIAMIGFVSLTLLRRTAWRAIDGPSGNLPVTATCLWCRYCQNFGKCSIFGKMLKYWHGTNLPRRRRYSRDIGADIEA